MMQREIFTLRGRRIWVAGHLGLVGSALVRRLRGEDCEILAATRAQLDLRRQAETEEWVAATKPDAVILAAATVGGILANSTRPAEFIYDNIAIATNVVEACRAGRVGKVLVLGSSCIYPRECVMPIREDALLTGPLEETNQWYAVAKIAALKLAQAYRRQYGMDVISAMPTNLYGPNDNFDLESGHVVPALIRKIHEQKRKASGAVSVWGSGNARREFLHVDDCADALVHLMNYYSHEAPINIGTGCDVSIRELIRLIADVVGYDGPFEYDSSKPDGTPQKRLDVTRLQELGWTARIELKEGLESTYRWFQRNVAAD